MVKNGTGLADREILDKMPVSIKNKQETKGKEKVTVIIPAESHFIGRDCTCKVGEPYNNLCCPVHGEKEVIDMKNVWNKETVQLKSNNPPMPTRNKGEDGFDFAARKNEWKKKYG